MDPLRLIFKIDYCVSRVCVLMDDPIVWEEMGSRQLCYRTNLWTEDVGQYSRDSSSWYD